MIVMLCVCRVPTEQQPEEPDAVAAESVVSEEYVSIGQQKANPDGKICRCGSSTHLQVSSHMCPLNARWGRDESRFQVDNNTFYLLWACPDHV